MGSKFWENWSTWLVVSDNLSFYFSVPCNYYHFVWIHNRKPIGVHWERCWIWSVEYEAWYIVGAPAILTLVLVLMAMVTVKEKRKSNVTVVLCFLKSAFGASHNFTTSGQELTIYQCCLCTLEVLSIVKYMLTLKPWMLGWPTIPVWVEWEGFQDVELPVLLSESSLWICELDFFLLSYGENKTWLIGPLLSNKKLYMKYVP